MLIVLLTHDPTAPKPGMVPSYRDPPRRVLRRGDLAQECQRRQGRWKGEDIHSTISERARPFSCNDSKVSSSECSHLGSARARGLLKDNTSRSSASDAHAAEPHLNMLVNRHLKQVRAEDLVRMRIQKNTFICRIRKSRVPEIKCLK